MKYFFLVATVIIIALQVLIFTTRGAEPTILILGGFATGLMIVITSTYWVFDK